MAGIKKTKMPLEKDILLAICKWLESKNYFFWRNNNKPVFDFKRGAFRHQPKYTPRGLPDIFIIVGGKIVGIEVKRDCAKLRPEQEYICKNMREHGGIYFVAHSVQEVSDIMLTALEI